MITLIFVGFLLHLCNAGLCDDPLHAPLFPPGSRFHGWDCNDIVRSMGSNLIHPTCSERIPDSSLIPPPELDWRQLRPQCVMPVRDQGQCGSCWAFASARSLAHRFCILDAQHPALVLSPQHQVDCDRGCYTNHPDICQSGCAGGYLDLTWRYLRDNGTVSEACQPYAAVDQPCHGEACFPNPSEPFHKFRSVDRYTVRTVLNIQREIMQYGPVMAGLMIYSDFLIYSGGIYMRGSGTQAAGGHAVSLIGWGTEAGIDYWIAENQWGQSWGEDGFFRIRRGTNEVGIEEFIHTGRPNITGLVYTTENESFLELDEDPQFFNGDSSQTAPLALLVVIVVVAWIVL
jgi:hypothetical protein